MADTKRRTHGSKNKKKSWKKTDIKDIEEHLEDERLQLRTGGLVAEKTDEQLFFVEKNTEVKTSDTQGIGKKKADKPLRCYQHLNPNPHIKPVPKPTLREPKQKSKRILEIEEKEKEGIYTKSKKRKMDEANAFKKKQAEEKERSKEAEKKSFDLWGDDDILVPKEANKKTKAEPNEHFLKVTKKTRKKTHKFYHQKPSGRPAVEVAASGASYNPTYEDHQALLLEAHKAEMKRLDSERDLNKQTSVPHIDRRVLQASYLQEMSAGLFNDGDDDDGDDDNDDDDSDGREERNSEDEDPSDNARPPNPPVRSDGRKTLKQRRKEKARKEEEKQLLNEKNEKRRLKDVYRLRSLKSEISKKEAQSEIKTRKRFEKRNDPNRVKKIGRQKYVAPFVEIKLSNELVPNLRKLKPEGNLMDDRFKSFQRRNMIPASVPMKRKRKYKLKMVEKRSHREFK